MLLTCGNFELASLGPKLMWVTSIWGSWLIPDLSKVCRMVLFVKQYIIELRSKLR